MRKGQASTRFIVERMQFCILPQEGASHFLIALKAQLSDPRVYPRVILGTLRHSVIT